MTILDTQVAVSLTTAVHAAALFIVNVSSSVVIVMAAFCMATVR